MVDKVSVPFNDCYGQPLLFLHKNSTLTSIIFQGDYSTKSPREKKTFRTLHTKGQKFALNVYFYLTLLLYYSFLLGGILSLR